MLGRPCTQSSLGARARAVQSRHTGVNHPSCLHSAVMVSCSLSITDADAEASTVLSRSRLDGLHTVPLPFEERIVQAWRRGAPNSDMDVKTLQKLVEVRGIAPQRHSCCAPWVRSLARCCGLTQRSRVD